MGDLCVFHRCPLPRRQSILHVLRFAAQAPNAIKNTEILSDFRAFLEASPRLELGNKDFADDLADARWVLRKACSIRVCGVFRLGKARLTAGFETNLSPFLISFLTLPETFILVECCLRRKRSAVHYSMQSISENRSSSIHLFINFDTSQYHPSYIFQATFIHLSITMEHLFFPS